MDIYFEFDTHNFLSLIMKVIKKNVYLLFFISFCLSEFRVHGVARFSLSEFTNKVFFLLLFQNEEIYLGIRFCF